MSDDRPLRELQTDRHRDGRQLVVDGVRWLVYELPAPALDRRAGSSLVFESEDVVRRIRTYPEQWRELSDAELWAISSEP